MIKDEIEEAGRIEGLINDAYDDIKHQVGEMDLELHKCEIVIKKEQPSPPIEKKKTLSPVKSRYQKPKGYTNSIKSVTLNSLKK